MYLDTVPNRNSPPAYLVRESYREDGKIKKRTIANVSFLTPEQVPGFRAVLKGATISANQTSFEDAFDLLSTTPHGHIAAVLGTMEKLRIPSLLGRGDSPERRAALRPHRRTHHLPRLQARPQRPPHRKIHYPHRRTLPA
jgi:hypothetical protein